MDEKCDRCHVARAVYEMITPTGGTIYLCGHHGREVITEDRDWSGYTLTHHDIMV